MNYQSDIAIAKKINPHLIELTFLQENKSLNLTEVQFGWLLANDLDPKKESCIILKTGHWTLLDKEAGEYVFAEMKSWPAVAILVHSSAQRILGSVGIGLTGHSHKLKVFSAEENALKWLDKMMKPA